MAGFRTNERTKRTNGWIPQAVRSEHRPFRAEGRLRRLQEWAEDVVATQCWIRRWAEALHRCGGHHWGAQHFVVNKSFVLFSDTRILRMFAFKYF